MSAETMFASMPCEEQTGCADAAPQARAVIAGGIAGLLATIAIDAGVVGLFPLIGIPADVSFSLIGDTAARGLSLIGLGLAGGVGLGLAIHYAVGPLLGVLFAILARRMGWLASSMRAAGLGVAYTEIISLPLLATPPLLLGLTMKDTAGWLGVSFIMHGVYGAVLGLAVWTGLRRGH